MSYYSDETITLHHGDSLDVLRTLDAGSVDCCVTSPPYFGLRDYGEPGQIGLEASPQEYVDKLRELFAEVRRVLADDGTLWLNLGDAYSGKANAGPTFDRHRGSSHRSGVVAAQRNMTAHAPYKSLLGMPWRVALALQADGWIIRCDVIWAKRNFMPEAVTDRPTSAHEYIFLLTKRPRYWYDADAIREESDPDQEAHNQRYAREYAAHTERASATGQPGNVNNVGIHSRPGRPGRNARSVWSISAQPFSGAHFAVMPPELARRCIVAGCRPGGTVLDPFHGSGTTGTVAVRNGRKYVGIELNQEYLDLSLRSPARLSDGILAFEGEVS